MTAPLTTLNDRLRRLSTAENRHLFWELVRTSFKVNDHNSILGVFWSLFGPLMMLVVFYFIFKRRFGHAIEAYGLYLLLGIILVNFFVNTVRNMLPTFRNDKGTYLNSVMPKEIFIASNLFMHFYRLLVELFFCAALSIYSGLWSWNGFVYLPPLLLAFLGLTAGVGLVLALLYTVARDVENFWTVISRLFLFVTPVFYTMDTLSPAMGRLVHWLNPLTPFLLSLRDIIMGNGAVAPAPFLHALVIGTLAFAIGYASFLRYEHPAMERA